jgi:hypothetical protein
LDGKIGAWCVWNDLDDNTRSKLNTLRAKDEIFTSGLPLFISIANDRVVPDFKYFVDREVYLVGVWYDFTILGEIAKLAKKVIVFGKTSFSQSEMDAWAQTFKIPEIKEKIRIPTHHHSAAITSWQYFNGSSQPPSFIINGDFHYEHYYNKCKGGISRQFIEYDRLKNEQ